jgi:hypothetical protein
MPASTPRFGIRYLAVGDSARGLRADLEANAKTTETALEKVQAFAAQLASLMQGGPGKTQAYIGLDTDGVPYFDPAGSVPKPVQIGLDTDSTPYFLDWSVT